MSDPTPTSLAYTVAEARKRLPLGRTAFYDAIRRKEIPSIRVGRRILIPIARFEAIFSRPQDSN